MPNELECEGKIRFGALPRETSDRLGRFSGNWLEFAPEDNAVVVRHVQPNGCPALTAVPCEMIFLLDALTPKQRAEMPGGVLYLKDHAGKILRVRVTGGEVRIQWPQEDYSKPTEVSPETVLGAVDARVARVNGWVRFRGAPAAVKELEAFVDGFEGLYPEGEMPAQCDGSWVRAELKNVNVGPAELVTTLRSLASPADSLEGEIDVGSFAADSVEGDFRLILRDGQMQAVRPSLWGDK